MNDVREINIGITKSKDAYSIALKVFGSYSCWVLLLLFMLSLQEWRRQLGE